MTVLLETRSLNKHFGALHATRDVSFTLEEGARLRVDGCREEVVARRVADVEVDPRVECHELDEVARALAAGASKACNRKVELRPFLAPPQ